MHADINALKTQRFECLDLIQKSENQLATAGHAQYVCQKAISLKMSLAPATSNQRRAMTINRAENMRIL
jgi:hypothetical protein